MSDTQAVPLPQLRVITLALLLGPLLFGGVLAYLRTSGDWSPDVEVPYLDVGAAGLGVLLAAVSFVVRGTVWGRAVAGPPHGRSSAGKETGYAVGVMIHFALLEAAMLLNLVAVLIVPEPWVNVGVAGFTFALAATSLPSEHQRDNAGFGR